MEIISKSWNAFSKEIADEYLKTFGAPSSSANEIIKDILPSLIRNKKSPSILDLGCGNGHLYEFLNSHKEIKYTGVDFSKPLIEAARNNYYDANFVIADINNLTKVLKNDFDLIIFSHVLEMLESPEKALFIARKFSKLILIKFFEPPTERFDEVELRDELGLEMFLILEENFQKNTIN